MSITATVIVAIAYLLLAAICIGIIATTIAILVLCVKALVYGSLAMDCLE